MLPVRNDYVLQYMRLIRMIELIATIAADINSCDYQYFVFFLRLHFFLSLPNHYSQRKLSFSHSCLCVKDFILLIAPSSPQSPLQFVFLA